MCPGGGALGWGYVLFCVCLLHCPGVLSLGVKKSSSKQFKLGKKPDGLVYRQGKAWAEPWAPKAGWRLRTLVCWASFSGASNQWGRKETGCLLFRFETQDQLLVKERNVLSLSCQGKCSVLAQPSAYPHRNALVGGGAGASYTPF